jgi:5-oxoprolinase (ATP-hydrolysing)
MPPFSRGLDEEGVAIESFRLLKEGRFLDDEVRALFKESRRLEDNISDLQAQVAANEVGGRLVRVMAREWGVDMFTRYVSFVCENAKEAVEEMLEQFSVENRFEEVHSIDNVEYMDDGTPLHLKLTLDRNSRQAIFDFTGTGPQVIGNTNAPPSITRSAVLYCLRSLLDR